MRALVKQFFTHPVFPDNPDKTAVAKVLNTAILFMLGCIIFVTTLYIIWSGEITSRFLIVVGTFFGLLGIKYLVRMGLVNQASWLMLLILWLIGISTFSTASGVQTPSYALLVILVLLAGILLGWRVALIVAVLNSLVGLVLLWMAADGRLIYSPLPNDDFRVWLFHSVAALVTVMLLHEGIGSIRAALTQAQYELHQRQLSEEKFAKVFRISAGAHLISELESGIILDVNKSFELLTGFAKERVIGNTITDLNIYKHKEDRNLWVDKLKRQGYVRDLEMLLRHSDGNFRICSLSIEAIELDNIPCVITFVQDITERKQAELTLLKSEARFRSIFEESAIGMVLMSQNHDIVKMNRAFANMLGYGEEELVGRFFKDITFPEDVETSLEYHHQLLENQLSNYQIEQRYIHKQGHVIWVLVSVSVVDSIAEQPFYAIAQVQNIDGRKQAETEREMLIQELKRSNTELERFAYTVSHDLKSPLVTIGGFLGFLEQDIETRDIDQLRQDIGSIRKAANNMQLLLDELLELSRVGRLMNPTEEISFLDIVNDALATTQGQLMACDVEILIRDKSPTVFGDRVRLVQVVQNLIDNAAKFSRGQTHPWIKIGVCQNDDCPVFYVQDNGIGIPPEYQEEIFEIFNKLDPKIEGTGVGLALVKRIVEVHNGRLWVESDGLGQGSTFYFTLNESDVSIS